MADSQLGIGEESTYGTGVAVDRFLPFRSSSIDVEKARLDDPGIVPGQRAIRRSQLAVGSTTVAGDLQYSLFQSDIAVFFKHLLGSVVTTGSGPYVHTITPGSTDGLGLTIQEGAPDNAGTVRPFTYSGCKVAAITISAAQDDATFTVSIVGQDDHTVAEGGVYVLQTATLPAGLARFLPEHFAFTLDKTGAAGETSQCVRSFSLTITNTMDTERFCLGSNIRKEPLLVAGQSLSVTGSIELEWTDITDYDRFAAQTITGGTFTIDNGLSSTAARSIVGTMDLETVGGAKPQISPSGLIYLTLNVRGVENTATSDAIQIVITDDNAAP
jgi:hypothetical protein